MDTNVSTTTPHIRTHGTRYLLVVEAVGGQKQQYRQLKICSRHEGQSLAATRSRNLWTHPKFFLSTHRHGHTDPSKDSRIEGLDLHSCGTRILPLQTFGVEPNVTPRRASMLPEFYPQHATILGGWGMTETLRCCEEKHQETDGGARDQNVWTIERREYLEPKLG